jgi:hypothetical protein
MCTPGTARAAPETYGDAMTHQSIDVYLNDHLAGGTFGADLARRLHTRTQGTDLEAEMRRLSIDIAADLDTLTDLMGRMGVTRNPAKQVIAWVAEKASRVKLSGLTAGSDQLGIYLSLEALSLGVEGKASLWMTLREVQTDYPELQLADLDRLIERAQRQRQILERQRIVVAKRALRGNV